MLNKQHKNPGGADKKNNSEESLLQSERQTAKPWRSYLFMAGKHEISSNVLASIGIFSYRRTNLFRVLSSAAVFINNNKIYFCFHLKQQASPSFTQFTVLKWKIKQQVNGQSQSMLCTINLLTGINSHKTCSLGSPAGNSSTDCI